MLRISGIILLCVLTYQVFSQDKDIQAIRNEILNEGLFLYRLEKASWLATDILVKDYPTILNRVQGYLSYPDQSDTKTIFWGQDLKIIFSVTFDSTDVEKIRMTESTSPTSQEYELVKLRRAVDDILNKNERKFFAFYKDTQPNIIPIISNDQRLAFILTGSQEKKLLIGNDYMLFFNDNNELIKKKKLHNSLIVLDQGSEKENPVSTMHTHVLKDQPFMTSTDICTFMLYMGASEIKKHVVVSQKGTSIFEADRKNLILVPK